MNYQPPPPGQQPYLPPQPGPPPGAPVYELSGWWRRFGASFLDGLIVWFVSFILSLPFGGASIYFDSMESDAGTAGGIAFDTAGTLISLGVFILLVPFVMSKNDGRTIGKMATGIRVVREDGTPVDFMFALVREFLVKNILFTIVAVFTLGIGWLLNYLWPLWDEQNRALHDKIVKSRVVRADGTPTGAVWGPGQPGAMAPPAYPQQPYPGQPAAPQQPYPGAPAPPPDPFARPAAPPPPAQPAPPQPPFPTAPPPPQPAQPYVPPQPPAPPGAPPAAPPQPPAQQPPAPPQPPQPPAPPAQQPPPPQPPMPPQPPQPPAAPPQAPPGYPQPPANAPVPPAPPANAPVPPPPAPPQPPQAPAQPPPYQPPPGFENPVPED